MVLLRVLRAFSVVTSVVVVAVLSFAAPAGAQNWADEFNTGSGGANGSNWVYDLGSNGGWGNNEAQTYTNSTANVVHVAGSPAFLRIRGTRTSAAGACGSVGSAGCTAGRIKSIHKVSFGKYGTMEARLRGPQANGTWPAFWMLGANHEVVGWPSCGEIDIMEHANTWTNTLGTLHWTGPTGAYAMYTFSNKNVGNFADWHQYKITWDGTFIRWYLDGHAHTADNIGGTGSEANITPADLSEFHGPQYLIFNLALNGNFTGNLVPAVGNHDFDIDWVRWTGGANTLDYGQSKIGLKAEHSGKCVDTNNGGTANGTQVRQWTCNNSNAQKFRFFPTDSGYFRLATSTNNNQVIDVAGGATATGDGVDLHIWQWTGGTNQQWKPEVVTNGTYLYYKMIARHSGKCLDVPGWNMGDGVILEQYTCNNTTNQKFILQ